MNAKVTRFVMCLLLLVGLTMAAFDRPAFALPVLQLDIGGGVYVGGSEETIFSVSGAFTLYALLDGTNPKANLTDTYYIAAAVVPATGPTSASLGSFTFAGNTVNVTNDMIYGVPPAETFMALDPGDLAKHGMYPTYFIEIPFAFTAGNTASAYNSQDNPGGPTPDPLGTLYFASFAVDTTNLAAGYGIHFDLYNTITRLGGDVDRRLFAPFSHDAECCTKVPEPGTVLLVGAGLLGLGVVGWRKK